MNDLDTLKATQCAPSMHDALMSAVKIDRLTRENFSLIAELMPGAVSVGASAMEMTVSQFLHALNNGELQALPVLLAMAVHIENKHTAH